jgi:hypothetical protein
MNSVWVTAKSWVLDRQACAFLSTAFILLVSSSTFAQTTTSDSNLNPLQLMHSVASDGANIMGRCSDRIWPAYNWKNLMFLQFDLANDSLSLSGATGTIATFDSSIIPEALRQSEFAFGQAHDTLFMMVNGEKYITDLISENNADKPIRFTQAESEQQVFALAVHEAFHKVVQPSWKLPDGSGSRGTLLPIQATPRLYRRGLYDRLHEAFLHPERSSTALAQARFWYDLWLKEYPDEAKVSTDLTEGTARYVETIAGAMLPLGCDTDEATLKSNVTAHVEGRIGESDRPAFGYDESGLALDLDGEGYDIGGMAALILRFQFPLLDWYQEANEGISPVAALLNPYAPLHDEIDLATADRFRLKQLEMQKQADELLRPSKALLQTPHNMLIVALPQTWGTEGVYRPIAFYIDTVTGYGFVPLRAPLHYVSPATARVKSEITIKEHGTPVFALPNSPCAEDHQTYWLVLVPKSAVVEADGRFNIVDTYLEGHMTGEIRQSSDGRSWLCGQ